MGKLPAEANGKIFIPRSFTGFIHVPDTITGGKCQIATSTGDINIRLKYWRFRLLPLTVRDYRLSENTKHSRTTDREKKIAVLQGDKPLARQHFLLYGAMNADLIRRDD